MYYLILIFLNNHVDNVDGTSAVSKKRLVKRHEFYSENVHSVMLETAGTVDLDVEVKFSFGDTRFSIDVDKKQIEQLKDLYKALFEIGKIQHKNNKSHDYGMKSLEMANEAIKKVHTDGNIANMLEEITKFNFNWINEVRENYNNKDFGYVYEKYINN